ncbi:MAG: type II toxin-antitoxin system HicB family antitoxin [Nanoarchaeota archaeon]
MTSFSAVIHREEDIYVAKCPEVGTVSQGKTIEESLKNLQEATELYLEEFPLKANVKPIMTVFEVSAHAKIKKAIGA